MELISPCLSLFIDVPVEADLWSTRRPVSDTLPRNAYVLGEIFARVLFFRPALTLRRKCGIRALYRGQTNVRARRLQVKYSPPFPSHSFKPPAVSGGKCEITFVHRDRSSREEVAGERERKTESEIDASERGVEISTGRG